MPIDRRRAPTKRTRTCASMGGQFDTSLLTHKVPYEVFLQHFQVSDTTLDRLVVRSKDGCECAHSKDEEGGRGARSDRSSKADEVVAWYDGYSKSIGDWMLTRSRRWCLDDFTARSMTSIRGPLKLAGAVQLQALLPCPPHPRGSQSHQPRPQAKQLSG